MKKGDLVRLNVEKCFTRKSGGYRKYPVTHWLDDEDGVIPGFYKLSHSERQRLSESPEYQGMNSAGETKIVGQEGTAYLKRGQVYTVVRARCSATRAYRKIGGLAQVLDPESGRLVFIKRDFLEAV